MHNLHNDQTGGPLKTSAANQQIEDNRNETPDIAGSSVDDNRAMELAIVGMAGRFPGAANLDEFWQNLANGVESISFFSDDEVEATGVEPATFQDPHYVKAGGYLEGVENFDAGFFNIYPREAAIMDPQHRIFLEVAWETLENAGYNPENYPGWIGLFAGMGMNTYLMFNLIPNHEIMDSVHGYQLTISSDKDFLPTRVSYKFNLRGPSVNVQTACSTSLVAVHLACQSLLSYQCDMALAGGVSIRLPQKTGYMYQEGGITSPDGHCRAFDARAAGTVSGNGAGAVLLKRLGDALRDGDTIHAIIKGSAINNDGSLKVGYTAPSVEGQAEVISMAQAIANIDPGTITYVETHGTGTALGDPIEIAALTQVFQSGSQAELAPGSCAIGSVKTNVGHLDAASGVVSLIKTTLALEKRQIPPSLHYTRPNPKIDFENSPFYVNTQLKPWETNGIPRRAGVSSFGIGGTNVHLILEEAAVLENEGSKHSSGSLSVARTEVRPWQLLLLSARSPAALEKATDDLAAHLKMNPEISLADAAYTLQVGRKPFNNRRMLVSQGVEETILALESRDPQRVYSGRPRENSGRSSGNSSSIRAVEFSRPQIVFMFSGQGAQYVDMARDLYESEEIFRNQVDACAEILVAHLGRDIREVIYAGSPETTTEQSHQTTIAGQLDEPDSSSGMQATSQVLMQTAMTQPALFVIEYALARLLMHWGIEPEAMIGHSIGEYVAGCLAGVFSLEDALALVAARGRLMQRVAPGAMVSIPLSEAEVQTYLSPGLSLSAVNAPTLCVVSGDFERIEALTYRLANDGIEYRRLRTSHAFHSEMMDEILEEFYQQVAAIELGKPTIPFISNVSGTWISPEQAIDPLYWVRHLRQTVRFGQGISEFLKDPAWTLVEVGPGQTLVQLARSVLTAWAASEGRPVDERVLLPTLRPPRNAQPDQEFLLNTLGRLWLAGVEVNWSGYYAAEQDGQDVGTGRRRIPLPAYPFEHKRYWVEPDVPLARLLAGGGRIPIESHQTSSEHTASASLLNRPIHKRSQPATWFYTPSWKRSIEPYQMNHSSGIAEDSPWLVFSLIETEGMATRGLGASLRKQIPAESALIEVMAGDGYLRIDKEHYQIDPENPQDYQRLLHDLVQQGQLPTRIVDFWSLNEGDYGLEAPSTGENLASPNGLFHLRGFFSLCYFVQACERLKITQQIQINLVTSGAYDVTGDETLYPEQASGVALCKVISQEYPNITCRNIDLVLPANRSRIDAAAEAIVAELNTQPPDRFVSYRGSHRWVQVYSSEQPPERLLDTVDQKFPVGSKIRRTTKFSLRQGGVYLITGGLGRIGLVLAEYLASKTQANLILVDRFEFPPSSLWESWLAEKGLDDPLSIRITRLLAMEAIGARLMVLQVDVADSSAMQWAFRLAHEHFGVVNGVIHAAGLVGEAAIKPLAEMTVGDISAQFAPKVLGLRAIHAVVKALDAQEKPDFVFLQSSLSTVLGGLGLGAYAAANAIMDLCAAQYNLEKETTWISVDWDGWQFDPVSGSRPGLGVSQRNELELTMTPGEGVQIFEFALEAAAMGVHHLVISVADLSARLDQWVLGISQGARRPGSLASLLDQESEPSLEIPAGGTVGSSSFTRPNLQTSYVAPRSDLEIAVTQAWEKVLGISPIGVYDDFFELGGHSLLATQLVTRLRDTFRVELPLRRLFESPTISSLVALIDESYKSSSQNADQEVENEHAELNVVKTTPSRIEKAPRVDEMPLSYGQQRLWFIDQFEPGSPLYNNFAALRLTGHMDQEALAYCLQKIVDRHESLRTTFTEHGGQPVQVVHSGMKVSIEAFDLQPGWNTASDEEREDQITHLAASEASQPFDLTQGPLFRMKLLKIHPEEQIIFLTMHHIVSDGWSVAVLITEVGALYAAFIAQKSGTSGIDLNSILPELPIQYVDYAAWQRKWLQGEQLNDLLAYWKEKLAGSQQLELFTDFPRPAVQTWHGANRWFELPHDLSNALVGLSQHESSTLFMTILAALQILLMRYSGQEDITVGTPIANRTRAEAESLIGFILNTLVLRTDCSGNPSFREFLGRVRDTALGAYAHQDLPFEMLVEALHPQRDMSRAPFFQVIFDLQVAPLQALNLTGLTIAPIPIDSGTAKFDLALSMEESIQGKEHSLKGYLNYNTDLFEARTIDRMLEHFQVLLGNIVALPDQSIWELPLLGEEEKQLLASGFFQAPESKIMAGQSEIPEQLDQQALPLIHEMIQSQAFQTPDAPALSLITGSSSRVSTIAKMTYQELDERANRVANYLIELGVVAETVVGLCMQRSLDMIVGLLGILKAGGAFLPLDPSYPTDRLAFMLEDSRAPVILTHASLLESNPELSALFTGDGLSMVLFDKELPVMPDQATTRSVEIIQSGLSAQAHVKRVGMDNLAYVIYTSGSTGKPKGVMITHEAVAGHCWDMAKHFQVCSNDHVLQFASLNFDAGLEQVFTSLISGAWLFLRDDNVWPANEFQEYIDRLSLTVVNVPPAYWQPWVQLVAEREAQLQGQSGLVAAPTLRLVIIGGDVMSLETLNVWWQTSLRRVRLLNAYGPTETTITATTYQVPDHPTADLSGSHYARIPIGKPHLNRTAYVLDQQGGLTPLGIPGELHLGGAYLSRGYLHQPELTAEKFIPDPFEPGTRLYKTGDLVRLLPDGSLDFLGRVDQQVKLRGFRIELGEIETVIGSYPGIAECVIVIHTTATEGKEDEKRLVAFVAMTPGQSFDPGGFFEFARSRLPGYMVPAIFISVGKYADNAANNASGIEFLPLTPSGKVDRKALAALPLPENAGATRKETILAPRSPLEKEILELWVEVLGHQISDRHSQISIDDNFFELGGHSLLATQIVSRLRQRYQVDLPLRQLFENPTIAGIASLIVQSLGAVEINPEADSSIPEAQDDIEALLAELEQMSDAEALELLSGDQSGLDNFDESKQRAEEESK